MSSSGGILMRSSAQTLVLAVVLATLSHPANAVIGHDARP
jgi:hypothetical protein